MEQSTKQLSMHTFQNRALTNLLSTFSLESKQKMLEDYGVDFHGECYAAMRIGIYAFPGAGTTLPDELLLSIRQLIGTGLEAALAPVCKAYFVAPEFYANAIFMAFPDAGHIEQSLSEMQAAVIRTFHKMEAEHQVCCYCAVSQPVASLEAMPLAYQQAQDLVITHRNTEMAVCYLAGEGDRPGSERDFLDTVRQVTVLLASRRYAELPDYLRQQYESGLIELADIRYLHSLLESYSSKYLGGQPVYAEALRQLSELMRHFYIQFDVAAWHRDLMAFAALLERAGDPQQTERTTNAGEQITAYLVEHQNDANLNLNLIADEFGLSASYASRAFKRYTGLTMLDFLTNLRIGKAKDLLRNTDMSVRSIAEAVGYTPDTLARTFRRTERISPSQYREANAKA